MIFRPPRKRLAAQRRGTVGGRRNCALPDHRAGKDAIWAADAVQSLLSAAGVTAPTSSCGQSPQLRIGGAKPGPWVEWSGGRCPIPDAPVYGFELRQRNGKAERPTLKAAWYGWDHRGDGDDIVAYRLIPLGPTLKAKRPWWEVLGVDESADSTTLMGAFCRMASAAVTAGDMGRVDEISAAYQEALKR